jgi:hypothetical protein
VDTTPYTWNTFLAPLSPMLLLLLSRHIDDLNIQIISILQLFIDPSIFLQPSTLQENTDLCANCICICQCHLRFCEICVCLRLRDDSLQFGGRFWNQQKLACRHKVSAARVTTARNRDIWKSGARTLEARLGHSSKRCASFERASCIFCIAGVV